MKLPLEADHRGAQVTGVPEQLVFPVASNAYRLWSSEPMYAMPLTTAGDESTLLPAMALNRWTRVGALATDMAVSPGLVPPSACPNLNSDHQSLGADSATARDALVAEWLFPLPPELSGPRAPTTLMTPSTSAESTATWPNHLKATRPLPWRLLMWESARSSCFRSPSTTRRGQDRR